MYTNSVDVLWKNMRFYVKYAFVPKICKIYNIIYSSMIDENPFTACR